jgi:hypothetical protein
MIKDGLWSIFYTLAAVGHVPPIVMIVMAWWYDRKRKQLKKAQAQTEQQ